MKVIPESGENPGEFLSTDDITVYNTNIEYLLDELHRIDLIIRSYLKKYRLDHQGYMDDFRGLYISEEEVNIILQTNICELKSDHFSDSELENIEAITREINQKKNYSINKGKELRFQILSDLFNLKPFEADVLLICLAPELDLRYEKLYSYLQNDVTKKRPTVDLVLKLLCTFIEEKFTERQKFLYTAALINNHLIYFTDDSPREEVTLLSRSLKVDERIISFLLGSDVIDPKIQNICTLIEPDKYFADIIIPEDEKNKLIELLQYYSHVKVPLIMQFNGPYGTGKKLMAEAICAELKMLLLVVDSKALIKDESFKILDIVIREARLQHSCIYLEGFDALFIEKDNGINIKNLILKLDNFPDFIFLSGEVTWEPQVVPAKHRFINFNVPIPSFKHRKQMWRSFLESYSLIIDDADINALATKFNFSGGQIKDTIYTANNIARLRKPGVNGLSIPDLYEGAKARSNKKLGELAKKIIPLHTWEDIILPADIKAQLKEIRLYIKYKGIVYSDWKFDKKLSLGKGLNALFSGPSGTGKTMAAQIIAKEAQLDLYKIDLSSVISKYIGETEKNLSKIFKEAETSNAILFFDEADALFGKRSEVKDAHDRYANIETGYLLQKMEEYEGVVILATNLSKNIDDAFIRRMQFIVEFPFPDKTLRKQIWAGIFPEEAPLSKDINFDFLSEKLKLAGGNIKNIAVASAFYAADRSSRIEMSYIMHAAKREYQKMGKTFLKADFTPYYELIEAE
jgi:SpoVK/Ycf46/Vps4 family AAA+-type ATPase